ncbi:MAG: hypothetical protein H6582_01630 [Crocinitomicaceae bacterium]|nr:hypothetical protein [Crocinitomicaceae bacterium]
MSKQKGLIKLEGNIGGISFYSSDGEHLARMANGPSKDRISKDPAFKRTRENNMEFGGSAKVSKALRSALSTVLQSMAGRYLTSRLTKIFKIINLKATGTRGERPIELSQYKDTLKNFDLDKNTNLSSVFSAPYTATINADKNEGTIDVPSFIPDDFINAPAGATHFKLVLAMGAVSDYQFNAGVNGYEPVEPSQNGLSAVIYSPILALGATAVTANLVAAFNGAPVIAAEVSVPMCLGIEFYQQVGTDYYVFAQDNAMKIIEVF